MSSLWTFFSLLVVWKLIQLTVDNFCPPAIAGRMGNTKQALQLITNELGDVNQAIQFCKEHNERELWEDLISYSIDKPSEYLLRCTRLFLWHIFSTQRRFLCEF